MLKNIVMLKKIAASALVVATVAGASLATTGTAEARYGRNGAAALGVGAGLVGGLLLGNALSQPAYAAPVYQPAPVYVEPEPVYVQPACYWQRHNVPNTYGPGYHIERVRVCQ